MHFGKTAPTPEGSSEHDILLDDLSLPPNPVTGSSSVIIGVSSSGKHPSDSDVRLVPDNVKGASDSDVRLATRRLRPAAAQRFRRDPDQGRHGRPRHPDAAVGQRHGRAPEPVPRARRPRSRASQSDSDFDLNPSSELIDALQPDSGSDFELTALDASDEFEATPLASPAIRT